MILHALCDFYHRLSKDPANGLPNPGYSLQNISFCVIIRADGSLVEIQPTRQEVIEIGKNGKEKKSLRPLFLQVPGQAKPPGQGINPCFLWDNSGYMLGYKPDDAKRERTSAAFAAFKQRHLELENEIRDEEFSAVCRFLTAWDPSQAEQHPALKDAATGFGVFQVAGRTHYVHQTRTITKWWEFQDTGSDDTERGFCLVTGENGPLAQLHDPAIKGVAGAQSMGAKLVSFNLDAFTSLGKEQGLNSPVSEQAAFAYCNALNYLLGSKDRRFRIGDATTVFWTGKATAAETIFPWMMAGVPETEDSDTRERVRATLQKIAQGTLGKDELGDPAVPYFILGLSPNASRLSVRFWHTGTLGELVGNLTKHFQQLQLVRQWDETNSKNPEPLAPSTYQLLRQTARDADGIAPLLGGALIRAILLGTRYPDALVHGVMNRIRVVEKKPQGDGSLDNVPYLRAAILKAWLIRNHRQPITAMLDETNTNPGYRLGRLFAVLEKAQQDALPGINTTIRERFYASASATPRAVFGRLLRTYQHHLGKLDPGPKFAREKQAQDILEGVSDFPAHLNLQDQAQFALGYYHQRKDFFTKKEAPASTEPATA